MTEKRFEEVYGEMGLFRVKDNKTGKCYKAVLCGNPFTETDKPILDILNEIADENEQLKQQRNEFLNDLDKLEIAITKVQNEFEDNSDVQKAIERIIIIKRELKQ